MKIMDRESFKKIEATDPYYRGRWAYISVALAFAKAVIPKRGARVVEIGPGTHPLFDPSTRIDVKPYPHFISHDVGIAPWPVEQFDLCVALQVWEHLGHRNGGRQEAAFQEMMQHANNAILSFPLNWRSGDEAHRGITREDIARWTLNIEPTAEIEARGRLICLWRF